MAALTDCVDDVDTTSAVKSLQKQNVEAKEPADDSLTGRAFEVVSVENADETTTGRRLPTLSLPTMPSGQVQEFCGYVQKLTETKVVLRLWDDHGSEINRMFERTLLERKGITVEGQPVYLGIESNANGDLKMILRSLGPTDGPFRKKLVDLNYSEFKNFNG